MKQQVGKLSVKTQGQGLTMITADLSSWILRSAINTGLLTIWCKHTSASLTVQENTDISVRSDILNYFNDLVPGNRSYQHADEGSDDMPAHLKTMLTETSLSIPVIERKLSLGPWQAVYLFEHRKRPHIRELVLHVMGN